MGMTMALRISTTMAFLAAMAPVALAPAAASASPLAFTFEFDTPAFVKPELAPLNALFTTAGIDRVFGSLAYDSEDAVFVTSEFTLSSNIDVLFDLPPDELVFAPFSGNLNQIRSWEVRIDGFRYILELTGLDPLELLPNRWFGGLITETGEGNVFDLVAAGGGLTPQVIPLPAALFPMLGALGLLAGLAGVSARRRTIA
jgi:hypothetical protein